MLKYFGFIIGTVLGIVFLIGFFITDPTTTVQGVSLRLFYLFMGLWFGSTPFLVLGMVRLIRKNKQNRKRFFIKYGIKATATILFMQPTGLYVNRIPQYKFRLGLATVDGRQITVTAKKTVDYMDMGTLKPGLKIPALVHPKKDNEFFLFWNGTMDV